MEKNLAKRKKNIAKRNKKRNWENHPRRNEPSHTDSPLWIDKSLDLVADIFEKVYVRGDTDFRL